MSGTLHGSVITLDSLAGPVTVVPYQQTGDGWHCVVIASTNNTSYPVGSPNVHVSTRRLEAGRRVGPARFTTTPPRAPEPGTGELGTWKPEVIRAVQALRELDWTGFDPTSLDDLADVAAAVVNESDATFDPILPPPTE